MYLRVVKVPDKKTNVVRQYLRLEESYRQSGKLKKRVIAYLGRLDLIKQEQLVRLAKSLANFSKQQLYISDELKATDAFILGPILVIRKIWEETNLAGIISEVCGNEDIAERVFVLICCRLLQPESEHGLSYFLKEYYVCDKNGRRWEPEFRQDLHQRKNNDRVKAQWAKLAKWYRALDKLIDNKERIEKQIYSNVRNLFSIKVDVIFYDITSVYFEGNGPTRLARFGYSRDGKADNKQVLLGIVMADGLPIAHHVFAGNIQDKKTLNFVLSDLSKRFELKNIIFVADKGITSKENIESLKQAECKYILGVSPRVCRQAKEILGMGGKLLWRENNNKVKYTQVEKEDKRWILVDSQEKSEYERKMRQTWMEKGAKELENLKMRVESGRLKDQKKISYYLGGISKKYHISRYFSWEVKEGKFRFWVDDKKLKDEMMYEGKYLLTTNDKDLSPQDIIREYKNLWEVESCFRHIKDVIKIRPIYHKREQRVKAHIFVAVLAYLIEKVLHRRLMCNGIMLAVSDVLEFSKTIKVVELEGCGKRIKLLTQNIDKRVEKVLKLFGLKIPRMFKEGVEEIFKDENSQKQITFQSCGD